MRGHGPFPNSAQDSTTTAGEALTIGFDLTIARDVQLHQLHEVGDLRGKPLDFIVAQAQLAQVQEPEERLRQERAKRGQQQLCGKPVCAATSGQT